jgi:hypothetical protein
MKDKFFISGAKTERGECVLNEILFNTMLSTNP